eukprot:jgi/Tetstr1/456435/TSEL_043165.t2
MRRGCRRGQPGTCGRQPTQDGRPRLPTLVQAGTQPPSALRACRRSRPSIGAIGSSGCTPERAEGSLARRGPVAPHAGAGGVAGDAVAAAGEGEVPRWTPRLTLAAMCICLASWHFGFHSGVMNLPLNAIAASLHMGLAAKSATVSALVVGGAAGALGCAPLSDRLGRRSALIAAAAPLLVGAVVCGAASGAAMLCAGRFLCGLGVGASSVVAPALVAELSPPASRGLASTLTRLAYVVGVLTSYVAATLLQTDAALGWWRQLFAWAAVPSIVLAGTMLAGASPESPSWLARQGRTADAASALRAVQGVSQGAAERWVSAEVALSEQASRGGGGGWGELLRPEHRRSMQICCGLALAQALGGSNAVIYFAATMFAGAGATGSQATGSILVGLCNLAGTFLALRLSDGLGRKPLLLGSFSGMAICMAALAASQLPTVTTAAPMVASTVVSVAVPAFVLVFASAVGPLPYLLYSEVLAARVRGKGTSLVGALNWAAVLLLSATFLPLYTQLGPSVTFALYAAINLAAALFVHLCVFETKGRSLQEIERELASQRRSAKGKPL